MPRSVNGSTWPNNGQEFNIEALIHHAGDTGAITFLHQQVLVDPWRGSRPTNDNGGRMLARFYDRARPAY